MASSIADTTLEVLTSPWLSLSVLLSSMVLLPEQPASMETAMTPASIREAIFLSFIVNFSSLWCIKDRDPKQVERKVLSFQRHYSIPPRCQGPIYYFLVFAFFSLLWEEV